MLPCYLDKKYQKNTWFQQLKCKDLLFLKYLLPDWLCLALRCLFNGEKKETGCRNLNGLLELITKKVYLADIFASNTFSCFPFL